MKFSRNWVILLLTGLGLPAQAALLRIDQSQSRIEVAVNSTAGSFVGKLEKYQATVECQPPEPLPAKADVSFDFKDFKTGIPDRDTHMLKWLQYPKNPTASFHLKSWKQEGGDTYAVGELALHGIQKEIRMPVTINRKGDQYEIEGTARVDYRDFGLPKIHTALVFTVDPHIRIQFRLVGRTAE